MWTYIFILFLQFGELVQFNLIGTITISGIVYLFWFVYLSFSGKFFHILKGRLINHISILYLLLLAFQFISEILVGNEYSNMAKGLAVTILSYVKFICLWSILKYDRKRILWVFLCMAISGFINFQAINEEEYSVNDIMRGTEFTIFKFRIAPLIGDLLVVFSLCFGKSYTSLLFMSIGASCAVLGARSTGGIIFLTGLIVYAINHMNRVVTKGQVVTWSIVGCIISYVAFILYVNAVLSGAIIGGNSKEQFAKIENPYNPMYVLLSGRTESPASLAAIGDKPWTGFGAWAKDPDYKYHKIKAKYQKDIFEYRGKANIIPAHSVVLQTGVNEGVFAMSMIILIILFFIYKGTCSLRKNNEYNYLIVFCIIQLIWNGLFSPVAHFKETFPIFFCCCLFVYHQYIISKIRKNHETRNIGHNSNSWRKRFSKKNY